MFLISFPLTQCHPVCPCVCWNLLNHKLRCQKCCRIINFPTINPPLWCHSSILLHIWFTFKQLSLFLQIHKDMKKYHRTSYLCTWVKNISIIINITFFFSFCKGPFKCSFNFIVTSVLVNTSQRSTPLLITRENSTSLW